MRRTIGGLMVAATMAFAVAACGSSSGSSGSSAPQPTTASSSTSNSGSCDVQVSTDTTQKPTITIPDCAQKPTSLVIKDVVPGTGPAAKQGDTVVVKYDGVAWSNKQEFDASWTNGLGQFPVQNLGQASVIEGWNKGLIGAQKGARRLLVIPPSLGYGAQNYGPIKANETLVFVVDVVSVN